MSTFVFSDTHFTTKFNQKLHDKLVSLINANDTIIINGDFWEGLAITFDEFLDSKWNKLFPLLKSKNTIYIYGNHDEARYSDDRIYRFCNKAVSEYQYNKPKQKFFFTHGEEFLFPKINDREMEFKKARTWLKKSEVLLAGYIQSIIFNMFGAYALPKRFNKMTVEEREKITSLDNLLICGHSHTPDYNKDLNFMDLGYFNYGWANYLIIDEEGDFKFHSERF